MLWAGPSRKPDQADGPCNTRHAVPGPQHRPDVSAQHNPYNFRVVLGQGSFSRSLVGLMPGQCDTVHWLDITINIVFDIFIIQHLAFLWICI
jgi:hypothetical protein